MAAPCFCGCDRTIPLRLRLRAANGLGRQMDRDLRLFRGALERDENDPQTTTELRALVDEGTVHRDDLRDVLHGLRAGTSGGKEGRRDWLDRAAKHRKRLWTAVAEAGHPGLDAARDADLVYGGAHAPARVLDLEATGTTLNEDPKVRISFRVEPPGEEPFEVERTLFVSRVAIPRLGERVTVHYDPEDRSHVTFLRRDLIDDGLAVPPPEEPSGAIALLERLRAEGKLSAEEFEAEKARLLGDG